MKKVILFFAVAAMFAACKPKQAEKTEQATDSVAAVVDTTAAVVDSAAATVDSVATAVVK